MEGCDDGLEGRAQLQPGLQRRSDSKAALKAAAASPAQSSQLALSFNAICSLFLVVVAVVALVVVAVVAVLVCGCRRRCCFSSLEIQDSKNEHKDSIVLIFFLLSFFFPRVIDETGEGGRIIC